jgi:NAD(P)-dependent dehydrogenase (short-subunit alcohol dehydrogenase family)
MRGASERLAGKRALVTGGASGIGAAIVARFRSEGADVVAADVDGGEVTMDVRSSSSVEAGVSAAVERLGRLDAVVCNAGIPAVGAAHELEERAWDEALATNVRGVFLTARATWPHLRESRGSIAATASVVGLWASAGQAAYCAAKAAVVMLTKCMALDGAADGIRANCVCPGFVQTPMLDRFLASQPEPDVARAAATALHPLGRLGAPTDVADAFVYLASDEAGWVTGTALVVDGGLTAGVRP